MSRRPPAATEDELPDDVRLEIVASLFADAKSMISGVVMTCLAGAVIAYLMHSWAACAATAATIVVAAARLRLLGEQGRLSTLGDLARALRVERRYVIGASLYMLCVGAIAAVAVAGSSDPVVLALAMSIAVTNVVSIAVRNFAVQYGVGWQAGAGLLPLAVALLLRGGLFLILIPMLLAPLWLFVRGSASRLRTMLLDEVAYRRRSETIAGQFDFAINNMSHGMCMISADRKALVSNAKFGELFGLPAERAIVGIRLESLIRHAVRRRKMSAEEGRRLLEAIATPEPAERQRALQVESADGGVNEVTLRRSANGGWVIVVQDVTEKRNAERVIDRMARFDAVTGLRNRGAFELALAEALAEARVGGERTEVLFVDLDRFKQVNDTLGHKVGDKVLVAAAERLCALAGKSDFIARWGGDEFIILRSRPVGATDIDAFAAAIIDELSRPHSIEGVEIVVGASIGMAVAVGGEPPVEAVLQQADMALYAAKRDGRGRYRIYEEAMSAEAQARRILELELHAAMAARAFDLEYQPIVDLETHAVVGLEALARWRHPTRGPISPAVFIPILEDLNLINEFGAWALQRACSDATRWPARVRVAVNVSVKQLEADVLHDAVVRALASTGLSPDRLELEITETALLGGDGEAQRNLERVHALGARIALDDFGTGYSSLAHLMRFPLDKVKIDQSFTRQIDKEEKAAILIENVARLSRQLGMAVTIEGIETPEQLARVLRLKPTPEGQGYLFSQPLAVEALDRLFAGEGALRVA